jgi:hypothetical protein
MIAALLALVVPLDPARGEQDAGTLKVSSDFPGGSANVESIDGATRTIRVAPAAHPDRGWACWWYFKVEGIRAGETVTVVLQSNDGFALADRAMWSLDDREWTHTAPGKREKGRVTYAQKIDADHAWFAWGPPYTLRHARAAVDAAARACPGAEAFELCRSREGRPVPAIRWARPGDGRFGLWFNARQHAWESGGSWVGQGLLDWLVSDDEGAKALRERANFTLVPMMDVDNAEIGAGGKNQKPHDHNRDWSEAPVFPAVRAAQERIREMDVPGRFDLYVDLHNPGPGDRSPFFFVSPKEMLSEKGKRNLDRFFALAREEIAGPLKLDPKLRESGKDYDPKMWTFISKNWVTKNTKDHTVAVTLETSWNTLSSTVENYKRVGRELGRAVERYLREDPRR